MKYNILRRHHGYNHSIILLATTLATALLFTVLSPLGSAVAQTGETKAEGIFSQIETDTLPSVGIETLSSRLVKIDFEQLYRVTKPRGIPHPATPKTSAPLTLALNLFDDVAFTSIVEHVEPTSAGHALWGSLEGVERGTMTLIVNGDVVVGTVRTPQAVYTIRTLSDGVYIIRQIDESSLLSLTEPQSQPPIPVSHPQTTNALQDDGSGIDVMVVYTPLAKHNEGRRAAIEALIDLFVAETNHAYANSRVIHRIKLVLKKEVEYFESFEPFTDLERLVSDSDGYMDEIHEWRDMYAADLVVLVTGIGSICGGAYSSEARDPSDGFAVVVHYCGSLVFAHELGHNMGLRHDRYQVLRNEERTEALDGYNYGYVNQRMFLPGAPESTRWTTIMAYPTQCRDFAEDFYCDQIPYFSNPDVTYNGDPMGVPTDHPFTGVDGPTDAVEFLNNNREIFANYRRSATSTPRVNLTLSQYSLSENGDVSTVTATLHRPSNADTKVEVLVSSSDAVDIGANRTLTIPAGRRTSIDTTTITRLDTGGQAEVLSVTVSGTVVNTSSEGVIAPAPILLTVYDETPASHTSTRAVLEALYIATDGDNWTHNDNWLTDAPLNEWYGVSADYNGVIGLYLISNNLTGTIPRELGNLPNLEWLVIQDSNLRGTIPSELGSLSNLKSLDLSNNDLTGAVPRELGSLSNLKSLDLSNNDLTGEVPHELGSLSSLLTLGLDSNQFAGSIPAELGNMSSLAELHLSGNELTGAIPGELGNLSNLEHLSLWDNNLTGTIPSELGNLSSLADLYLSGNELTGAIPRELGNLSNLETLSLSGNELTGTIPRELGNLSSLKILSIQDSRLAGTVPHELGNLSNLEQLYLDTNNLTGAVPHELGNLNDLVLLRLENNQLTGPLPNSLTNLTALDFLNFDNNAGLCAPTDDAFQNWLRSIIEAIGPNCSDTEPPPPTITCEEALTGDAIIEDSWPRNCPSANQGGSYARYYTFTLTDSAEVTIALESSVDSVLYLLSGTGRDGSPLCENDDYATQVGRDPCDIIDYTLDSQYDSGIVANLAPGDYTIEATTYNASTTGDFTLTVTGLDRGTAQPPEPPPSSGRYTSLVIGELHTCGLRTDGTVTCWGNNEFGQVSDTPTGAFTSIAAGPDHTCGIRTDNTVACWGNDGYGQVSGTPTGGAFSTIITGRYHTCAIRTDGSAFCWGRNDHGQTTPP